MNQVADIRKARKLSQQAVCNLSGGLLSQFKLSQIEREEVIPRPEERTALSHILGCTEEDLFPMEVKRTPRPLKK
jgi:transcriptional regulator with XRE-family HTH domain